jgi:hypothetical protein
MLSETHLSNLKFLAKTAAEDQALVTIGTQLAKFTAATFTRVGHEMHCIGHTFGPDRVNGASPGGHGSDEIVAVSF